MKGAVRIFSAVGALASSLLILSPMTPGTAIADSTPTLGVAHPNEWAEGFGTVRPNTFSIASTASSTVRQIAWDSWGGPQAIGHGVTYGGVDDPDVAVQVVAFDLGDCNGQFVYRQVARVAPGQSFNAGDGHNVCHG
jgi:hypothetical protein